MLTLPSSTSYASFSLRYLKQNRILYVTLADCHSADELDYYYEAVSSAIQCWPPHLPYLALFDTSADPITLWLPHNVRRTAEMLAKFPPDLAGRTAIIMNTAPTSYIAQDSVAQVYNNRTPNIPTRVFFSAKQGLRWLEELL